MIPHWHMDAILAAAKDRAIDLSPTDFLPFEPEAVA